jgi:hypothetical protein
MSSPKIDQRVEAVHAGHANIAAATAVAAVRAAEFDELFAPEADAAAAAFAAVDVDFRLIEEFHGTNAVFGGNPNKKGNGYPFPGES